MADTILDDEQLTSVFVSLTETMLNTTTPGAVRLTRLQDGSPGFNVSDEVAFVYVQPMSDDYTRFVQTDYSILDDANLNQNQTYTDGFRVYWTLYGPSAVDNSRLIWSQLFTDAARITLQQSNLALITNVPKPIKAPENRNGQWFNRASLYANFNELVIRQSTIPSIASANVQIIEG